MRMLHHTTSPAHAFYQQQWHAHQLCKISLSKERRLYEKNPAVKTRIIFGQDVSTYFPRSIKIFLDYEGHGPQRNKTEGLGSMVRLLTSREFGFNFELSDMSLKKH